jgi:hypothetical protein
MPNTCSDAELGHEGVHEEGVGVMTPASVVSATALLVQGEVHPASTGSMVSADIAIWSVKSISSQLIPSANQANYLRQPW